jgi:molybdopterin-containing oxidoreductase family membrane subunit
MKTAEKATLTVTGLMMLAGLIAYIYQYKEGLIVTHMANAYSWGLYVSGLAFFVGNAAGGLVLSSLIYLFGVKSLKPFAKLGALAAFANVSAAMLSILPDIGQPLRLLNMALHPQFLSPLVWDVAVLNLYALLSLVYLYVLMLPELKGPLAKIAIKVDDPEAFSEKWAKRLAPFSLVAAVGIHVVTAWIFATQGAREWWNTAILAPDFVAVAMASGTAVVFIASIFAYGARDEYQPAYRIMALIMAIATFVHIFFMYNDFFIHIWYGNRESLDVLAITLKRYAVTHAFEVLAPLIAVILLLNQRIRKSAFAVVACCTLLVLGVFAHRYLLMPAAFERVPLTLHPLGMQHGEWSAPIASGRYSSHGDTFVTQWDYFPSGIEFAVFLGAVAFVCFLLILAIRTLPIIKEVKS